MAGLRDITCGDGEVFDARNEELFFFSFFYLAELRDWGKLGRTRVTSIVYS